MPAIAKALLIVRVTTSRGRGRAASPRDGAGGELGVRLVDDDDAGRGGADRLDDVERRARCRSGCSASAGRRRRAVLARPPRPRPRRVEREVGGARHARPSRSRCRPRSAGAWSTTARSPARCGPARRTPAAPAAAPRWSRWPPRPAPSPAATRPCRQVAPRGPSRSATRLAVRVAVAASPAAPPTAAAGRRPAPATAACGFSLVLSCDRRVELRRAVRRAAPQVVAHRQVVQPAISALTGRAPARPRRARQVLGAAERDRRAGRRRPAPRG